MTEPYVAELVHPRMALKKPQPPPPLNSGLQHCDGSALYLGAVKGWVEATYIDVPDALIDVVGPGAIAKFSGFATAQGLIPIMHLKAPNSAGEQAGGNEIQQASGKHKEDLHLRGRSAPMAGSANENGRRERGVSALLLLVQGITNDAASQQAYDDGEGN